MPGSAVSNGMDSLDIDLGMPTVANVNNAHSDFDMVPMVGYSNVALWKDH